MDKNKLLIGSTTFEHIPHFQTWTEEKFIETYKGKVSFDLKDAWIQIQDRLEELGITSIKNKMRNDKVDKLRANQKEKGSLNINKK